MNNITYETRNDSFEEIKPKRKVRYDEILDVLNMGDKEWTAKEIAYVLYRLRIIPSNERNYTAPRLNELEKQGRVKVIGKKKCDWTGRNVAIYKAIDWSTIGLENRSCY